MISVFQRVFNLQKTEEVTFLQLDKAISELSTGAYRVVIGRLTFKSALLKLQ
jgi:hypothetical protein